MEELTRGGEAIAGLEAVDVIPVRTARVEEVQQAVQTLYVEKQNRERGADSVRVSADSRLNAIIVRGTPADLAAVRSLVERLDGTSIAAVAEIKRLELTKADAGEVVRLLQNVLAGRPIAGTGVVGRAGPTAPVRPRADRRRTHRRHRANRRRPRSAGQSRNR